MENRKEELKEILEKVSYFEKDVDFVLNKGNKQLLWEKEDDEALKLASSTKDFGFITLDKYKGEDRILRRIKYI